MSDDRLYPHKVWRIEEPPERRVSRDEFALAAMQAMVTTRCFPWDRDTAIHAYAIADAMIAERDRKAGGA